MPGRSSWSTTRSGGSRTGCPRACSSPSSASRTARADAVAAAGEHIDADATVVVINGDVPLITAEAIAGARRGPRGRAAPPGRWRRWSSTTRPSYGRVVRDSEGNVERVVEAKARGRRDARAARDPRGQHRRLRVRRRQPARRARPDRHRQRAGRALPARRAAEAARGRARRSPRTWSPTRRSRSASTTASSSRSVRKLAQRRIHDAPRAQRRHDRRPRHDARSTST